MRSKLSSLTRLAVLASSLAMIAVIFLPIWRIELSAPQYPEGLTLQIFARRIGGNVDIVNGLNHYIGMHALHTRDFVEFLVLPYIIGTFAALGLLVAFTNRKALFYGWFWLFVLIAFTSIIDFYRWEYNYGHNLDPAAPIQVPGMAYQPPLLGYKQLLNFGAFSIPDSGGWVFAGAGVILALAAFAEYRRTHRGAVKISGVAHLLLLFAPALLQSCETGPQPIRYGYDHCDYCKMGFSDRHYGAEALTRKGKVYLFDDLHCLVASMQAGNPQWAQVSTIYFVDYNSSRLINSSAAWLLRSDAFRTPMGGATAAFADSVSREKFAVTHHAQPITWNDLYR